MQPFISSCIITQNSPSASASTLLLRLDHQGEMNFLAIYYMNPAKIPFSDKGMDLPFRATDLSFAAVASTLSSV